jgi:hypothetical protein
MTARENEATDYRTSSQHDRPISVTPEKPKMVKNLIRAGAKTLEQSTLSTFNAKFRVYARGGVDYIHVQDDIP